MITTKALTNKTKGGQAFYISEGHPTKVYITNNIVEVITVQKPSKAPTRIRRLNKNEYVNLETGEVLEYKKKEPRAFNRNSLMKSFASLRRLINNNFVGDNSELHVCLTYAEDMEDYEQACVDSRRFLKKFRYHHPSCEYIRVIEPQQSGRWHIHLLLKRMDGNSLYVDYKKVRELWGLGMVHVSRLPFADNYGAYFSARFTDIDAFEESKLKEKYPHAKQIIKGARLRYYPPNFKFYTCSKGIVRPQAIRMTYAEAKELVGNAPLAYSYTKKIVRQDESGEPREVNAILYEQFKRKDTI